MFLSAQILNSLARGLEQWLWFLGQDTFNQKTNLLVRYGFTRFKPRFTRGSSRYRCQWRGQCVELHSSCLGVYNQNGDSFIYIRAGYRCYLYTTSHPPCPGRYNKKHLITPKTELERIRFHVVVSGFLNWLEEYEQWLDTNLGSKYRKECYDAYHLKWQPPAKGRKWFRQFCRHPQTIRSIRAVVPDTVLLEARGEALVPNRFFKSRKFQPQLVAV